MEPNPPLLNSGREEGTDHSSPLLRYPPHPYIEDAESKDVQYESEPTSFHGPSRMDVSSTDSFPGALPGQLLIEYPGSLPTEDLEEERPINPPNTPQTLSESSFSYGTPCRHTELEESLDSFDSEETESIYENDATSQNLSSAVGLPPHVPYIQETPAVSIESQFEPFQLETIEEEPVEGTTASGVNTMDEEPRLQKETPRSTSFTAILNEDEEEIESDENELSVQFIENIEDESPANPENSLHHAFKTDRNESPQSTTRVGSGSLSLESMLAENSTVASLDIKAAGENHKSAEAEDKDEDENEDEDMLFSVPMARKVIPKGTALKLTISIPSGSEDSTRLPTSPKRDVYDPTSLRKPGPVKMESLEYGLVTRRRGILPPPSLKLPPVSSIPQEPPPSYEESMGLTNDPGVLLKDPFDGSDSESDSDSDSDDDDDEDEDAFDPNNEDDLYDTASSRLDVLDRLIAETKASRSFSLRKEPINTTTEVGSNEYEGKHLPSQEHQHLDATTTRPDYNENGPLIFRKPPRKEYRETFRLEPHPRISKTQHVGNIPLQPLSIGGSQAEPYDLSVNKLTSVPIPSNDTPSITEELPRHRSIRTFHGLLESRKPDQKPEDDMNRSSSLKLSNNSRDNLSGPRMVFKRDLGSKDRKGYSDMINILQGVINTLERPISMSELEISTAVDKSQIIVDSNSTSQRAKTHFSSSNALCSSEMASHIEEDRIEEDGGGEREKAQKELSENESEESDEPRSKDGDRSSTDDDQNSDHGPSSGGAEIMTGHTTSDHQDNQERGNSNTDSPPRENDGKTSLSSSNNSKTWGHHILNCEYMLEPVSTHQALEGHQTKLLSIEKQGLYSPSATNKNLTQKPNLSSKSPKGKYDTGRYIFGIFREAQNCTEKQEQKSTSQTIPCSTSAFTSLQKVSEYKDYPQKSEYVFPTSYVHGILESEPKNYKAVGDEKQSSWATLPGLAPVSHVLFSCLSCGFLDYKERTTCLRCTSPINSNKITLKSHSQLGQCTVCGYIGYQRGSACPGCHTQKAPQHCSIDTQQHGNKQPSGRWKPRKNWNCPHCAFHNFRQRTVCNSCGTPAVPPGAAQSGISQTVHGPKSPSWQPTKTTSSMPLSSIYSKLVYVNHASQIRTAQDVLKGSYKHKSYDTKENSHSAVEFAPEKRDYFFNYLRTIAIENKKTSF